MLLNIISAYYGNPNAKVDVTSQVKAALAAIVDHGTFSIYIWPSTWNIPDPDQNVTKGFIVTYQYGTLPTAPKLTKCGSDGDTIIINTMPYTGTLVVNKATYGANGFNLDITDSVSKSLKYYTESMIMEIGSTDFMNYFCGGRTFLKGGKKGVFSIDCTVEGETINAVAVDGQTLNFNNMLS